MVVTQRRDDGAVVVSDADGDGFVAAIGYARNGRLTGNQGYAGASGHIRDLAYLIADALLSRPARSPLNQNT